MRASDASRWIRPSLKSATIAVLLALFIFAVTATATADSRFGDEGTGAGQLSFPRGVAVSAKEGGDVYVADSSNFRIDQFEPAGTFVRAFGWDVDASAPAEALQTCTTATGCQRGSFGSGPGQLGPQVSRIAIDNSCAEQQPALTGAACEAFDPAYGDVYLADSLNFRVERFSPTGHFQLMFGGGVDKGPHHPGDLCTSAYIAEGDTCGAGEPGSGNGSFEQLSPFESWSGVPAPWPHGADNAGNAVAVGPDGTVYVGDYRRVQEFDPTGAYVGQRDLPAAGEPEFVTSLAVDPGGDLYANSPALDEVQTSTPPASGTYTLTFEGQTTSPLPFDAPGHCTANDPPSCVGIQEALEALPTIGAGNVEDNSDFAPGRPSRVSFIGQLGRQNVPQISSSAGPVATQIEGTPGELVRLGPGGEVLQTYDQGGEPTHIATDPAGELFAVDISGGGYQFRVYKRDGSPFSVFTSPQVVFGGGNGPTPADPGGIAVEAAHGLMYVSNAHEGGAKDDHIAVVSYPQAGPPAVTAEGSSDLEPTTATLTATLNPHGFETSYHFEYLTAAAYEANPPGDRFLGASSTSPRSVELLIHEDPVSAAVSGLQPETAYRFRLVAESECEPEPGRPLQPCEAEGPVETFETLPPVSLRGLTTQTVGPERVTLKAELNNNNSLAKGRWTICIGEDANYATGCSEGELEAGSGDFEAVTATFTKLHPNTEYHYQLIAENEYTPLVGHPDTTADQTFITEESLAEQDAREGCANALRREENNSTALPDCRAYEQVSEPQKHSGAVDNFVLSPSGDRAVYDSKGAFAGAAIKGVTTEYLAQRSAAGWRSQASIARVGEPGYEANSTSVGLTAIGWYSADLGRWLFTEQPGLNLLDSQEASTVYFSLGMADGPYLPRVTPTITAELLDGTGPLETSGQIAILAQIAGQAEDFSRFYVASRYRLTPPGKKGDPRPTDHRPGSGIGPSRIYEVSGVGGPAAKLQLAAEVPLKIAGGSSSDCTIDGDEPGTVALPRPIRGTSADGALLLYTAPIENAPGSQCGRGTPNPIGLFARVAGHEPSLLNVPPPTQCSAPSPCAANQQPTGGLSVYGVSPDGRRAWFLTSQPLIGSDTDSSPDLYLAHLSAEGQLEDLVQASAGEASSNHPQVGEGAGVQGVLKVSADGTHVAFVATGALTERPNSAGRSASPGADNLYVYDATTGELNFVADLCSGPGESGSIADQSNCPATLEGGNGPGVRNDSALWSNGTRNPPASLSPDGRFLLFDSFGRLSQDDGDDAADVYRFDFASRELTRISIGRRGNDASGNDSRFGALLPNQDTDNEIALPFALAEDSGRPISADGAVAIFFTAAPLVSADSNEGLHPGCGSGTGCDLYQWEEDGHGACREAGGCVSLISDGVDPHGTVDAGAISSSGGDITFLSPRGEVPGDTDGVSDLYDARIGGGFPPPPPPPPCRVGGSPEACHGESTHESLHPSETTEEIHSGGNGPQSLQCAKGKHRARKHGKVRCVTNKPAKKHHRHKKHHKPAGSDHGGGK